MNAETVNAFVRENSFWVTAAVVPLFFIARKVISAYRAPVVYSPEAEKILSLLGDPSAWTLYLYERNNWLKSSSTGLFIRASDYGYSFMDIRVGEIRGAERQHIFTDREKKAIYFAAREVHNYLTDAEAQSQVSAARKEIRKTLGLD